MNSPTSQSRKPLAAILRRPKNTKEKNKLTENQNTISKLLTALIVENKEYKIKPATKDQIEKFKQEATKRSVDQKVINQLIELYNIADNFYYEIVLGFHSCSDNTIFEWWDEKELWLGQRDFYTLRWIDNKFCLGDASSISFSTEYEFDTLIELIECCIREIKSAIDLDNSNI